MKITIKDEIRNTWAPFNMAVLEFSMNITKDDSLDELIHSLEEDVNEKYNIEDVIKIPRILDARNAYKAFGKDPSRYRLAVESLYRRLSKGNRLYRINNAVDLGNVLSIKTQKSIAVLDRDKIVGDIFIRIGRDTDEYYGIGRGKINIENIPLYEDEVGPFGSSTSDTERTMITNDTNKILLFIISYGGVSDLEEDIAYAKSLFTEYGHVERIESYIL